ncbi:MAG: manganese efflux pump [Bacilli bacterium]|nr:manganese efflux pump [Bacilli bacterium]
MTTIIIIAFSLSMDAFSLSLAYGTLNLNKKDMLSLSFIVGLYHFFMPQIGVIVGDTLLKIIKINPNFIVFIVLSFIGIEMIFESFKKEENIKKLKLMEMILFGLAVSIDSFSLGIGLKVITNNILISCIFFSAFSFIFTLIGLFIGKKTSEILGFISTLLGGIILVIMGVLYLI